MTINDAAPDPMEDPEQIGQAFDEVFDLVDEIVGRVTDDEIEQRLRHLLADTATLADEAGPSNLDRMLRGPGWDIRSRLDLADSIGPDPMALPGLIGPEVWDEMHRALRVAREQLVDVRAAVDAARREATEQLAVAAAAKRQAEEVTAGVNAYVDAALDRARSVLAEARAEAARLITEAKLGAQETLAAAQSLAEATNVQPDASGWSRARHLVLVGSAGSGKTAFLATVTQALMRGLDNGAYVGPLLPLKVDVQRPPIHWHRRPIPIEPLMLPPGTHGFPHKGLNRIAFSDLVSCTDVVDLVYDDEQVDVLINVDGRGEDDPSKLGAGHHSAGSLRFASTSWRTPEMRAGDGGTPKLPLLVLVLSHRWSDFGQPAIPGFDVDELIDCERRQREATALTHEGSTTTRDKPVEVYGYTTKK
ncbi:hypothetical protein M8C17_01555 [Micromonospora sp. RHAY321]|uniref:hypothetical protein n=1 Tax=Micromonospora sp. RHAY321 TaxID=2944807 RepID=UPI00207D042B|nr:hypothetical protein [Micromonospora sp. RHAY321]MCO1593847.1 hypothetical protein [Micromonospora sp. RHAY321]